LAGESVGRLVAELADVMAVKLAVWLVEMKAVLKDDY
jgi:hypothetical protein